MLGARLSLAAFKGALQPAIHIGDKVRHVWVQLTKKLMEFV